MIEHDFDEDFTPIAAELQRLPYLSPSRGFADRVISRIDKLNASAAGTIAQQLAAFETATADAAKATDKLSAFQSIARSAASWPF